MCCGYLCTYKRWVGVAKMVMDEALEKLACHPIGNSWQPLLEAQLSPNPCSLL